MLDFLSISAQSTKRGTLEIIPEYHLGGKDLMIRGGDFYAIWDEEAKLWLTDEFDAIQLIDRELRRYYEEHKAEFIGNHVPVRYLRNTSNKEIDKWHHYVKNQARDKFKPLNQKIIFADQETKRSDYASFKLPYPLVEGDHSAYDELMDKLYSPEERRKLEWAIGAVVTGASKKIQKFLVLYGSGGTGKSTVIGIIEKLFSTGPEDDDPKYTAAFVASDLVSSRNQFPLEPFKNDPIVAFQHDGKMDKIEDNSLFNSLVSHERMPVNTKNHSIYTTKFHAMLFLGTNSPVKITDARSGIIRRLIDVHPTGNTFDNKKYNSLIEKINFELPGIAWHCKEVYLSDPHRYDGYISTTMLGATNHFYNFVLDQYSKFKEEDGTSLVTAYEMYKAYCETANILVMNRDSFKEELKNYFEDFKERVRIDGDIRVRQYYSGFIADKFAYFAPDEEEQTEPEEPAEEESWLKFDCTSSIFDTICADCAAQYATDDEVQKPVSAWKFVTTTLKDLDTSRVHYVMVPVWHIIIDFDIKDENGNKNFELNLKEASKWPETYAELSKSGGGIHLHYFYDGDPMELSSIYGKDIEIKVYSGLQALRRKVSKCNDKPIAHIGSGLPKKTKKNMVKREQVLTDQKIGYLIEKALARQVGLTEKQIEEGQRAHTKPMIDFIKYILDEAYNSGVAYNASRYEKSIIAFAHTSTNNAQYCIRQTLKMKFQSETEFQADNDAPHEDKLVVLDCEVFPNLLLINWKYVGDNEPMNRLINPQPEEVEGLMMKKFFGYNNRKYDNHILYARAFLKYTEAEIYNLSKAIIKGDRNAMFGPAYNASYFDLYDLLSKKQSLKKWEIELGLTHLELGLDWDTPVPEDQWTRVSEYCDNDVISTEKVYEKRKEDFIAREILAKLSGLRVNDTTRMHTTKIIFGDNKNPQLVYTDLREEFPGYEHKNGVSTYKGIVTGEGGRVYAEPGMYYLVALLDIASMHPSTIRKLNLFGEYTKRFADIVDARLYIKHGELDKARELFDGAFAEYLDDVSNAKALAGALKIVINSVYGYTTATFPNPFKSPENVDNIVAKRGALFMVNLQEKVQDIGYTVAHIKTDSIKIPNADPEIIQFVMDYGKQYGYSFEHEATYEKMCLVNDAVYIAKYADGEHPFELSTGETVMTPWTATGKQFQVPYVFKNLFAHAPIKFEDVCEMFQVSTALYLDFNEDLPDGEHSYSFVGKVGQFCPVISGVGGGLLKRKAGEDKYNAATGSKDFRWLESDIVKTFDDPFSVIDFRFYSELVDDAKAAISEYGDFEEFVR